MADMVYSASHAPVHAGKSAMRQWYEKLGGGTIAGRTKQHVTEGAHALRAAGESAVVGAALGFVAANSVNGLDIPIPNTHYKLPIDGAVAAVGIIGAVVMAHEHIAADLRNAGASALTILAFRKTQEFVMHKKAAQMPPAGVKARMPMGTKAGNVVPVTPAKTHGDFGADPILAMAQAL